MFIVSQQLWNALGEAQRAELVSRVVCRLRRTSPAIMARWRPEDHVPIATYAESMAAKYGVQTYLSRANWILLAFATGPDFHKVPRIQQHLKISADIDSYITNLLNEFIEAGRDVQSPLGGR